jgi:hypothetical protein
MRNGKAKTFYLKYDRPVDEKAARVEIKVLHR